MFEKELLDALDIKKDENVDQMIQKVNGAIKKLLDYFSNLDGSEILKDDSECLKNLVVARKILAAESNGFRMLGEFKKFLQEDI